MAQIKIGRIVLGMAQTNTYFVYREGNDTCVVFDPADKGKYLFEKFSENGFKPEAILLTHGHFDHIWGVEELKELSGTEVYASEDEEDLLSDARKNVSASCGRPCTIKADHYLKENEELEIADMKIRCIKTPGHTPGGMCFYIEEAGFLIAGDTLFCESVGRTDLPGGSMGTLIRSIEDKILTLPDDTKIYPGHGDPTSVSNERAYNPFL